MAPRGGLKWNSLEQNFASRLALGSCASCSCSKMKNPSNTRARYSMRRITCTCIHPAPTLDEPLGYRNAIGVRTAHRGERRINCGRLLPRDANKYVQWAAYNERRGSRMYACRRPGSNGQGVLGSLYALHEKQGNIRDDDRHSVLSWYPGTGRIFRQYEIRCETGYSTKLVGCDEPAYLNLPS